MNVERGERKELRYSEISTTCILMYRFVFHHQIVKKNLIFYRVATSHLGAVDPIDL